MTTVTAPSYAAYRQDWLDLIREEAIEPDLSIVDPHHHLYERPRPLYLLPQLLEDAASGHRIEATVFIDSLSMYRADGPEEFRCIGETEFANGVAAMAASGIYGPTRACAAIVSAARLDLGARVRDVLEAHIRAGNGRFRGIRHITAWHADPVILPPNPNRRPGMLLEPAFREGFAQLAPLGLSFEAYQFHTQLDELLDLVRQFPDTSIVLNHVGTPLGVGPYAGRRDEVYVAWKSSIEQLARCPNVTVKLGGLGMSICGFGFHLRPRPPSSDALAAAWKPYIEPCIDLFGPSRCMFESNFPPDRGSCSYGILWNAFKKLSVGYTREERTELFAGTARRVYRLA